MTHPTDADAEDLTVRSAAAYLRISKSTLIRAIDAGRLTPTSITPGGHRRFSRADLDAFALTLRNAS